MELLNDLFVTASLALVLSFVVAKLFSRATAAHRDSDEPVFVEDVRSGQQLRVQITRSQRKAEFIVREPLEKVEEFSPIQVESHLKIERSCGEIAVESDSVGKDDEFHDGRLLDIQHQHEEIAVDPDVVEKIDEIQAEGHLEIGNGRGEIMVDSDVINPPTISPEEKFSEDIASEVSNAVQSMDCSLREKIAQVDVDGKIAEFVCEANLDGSAEQRNKERVQEISEVSTIEAGIPAQSDEIMVLKNDEEERDEEKEVAVDFEDDWEGIERSELEKVFMAASEFVVGSDSVASIGSDVQMNLYGLHKVATEGPCREPQPMPLKLSARAKWYQTFLPFASFFSVIHASSCYACYTLILLVRGTKFQLETQNYSLKRNT